MTQYCEGEKIFELEILKDLCVFSLPSPSIYMSLYVKVSLLSDIRYCRPLFCKHEHSTPRNSGFPAPIPQNGDFLETPITILIKCQQFMDTSTLNGTAQMISSGK